MTLNRRIRKRIYACLRFLMVVAILMVETITMYRSCTTTVTTRTIGTVSSSHNNDDGSPLSTSNIDYLSIQPGELPGYTGWARSGYTLAGFFQVVQPPTIRNTSPKADEFVVVIQCTHPNGRHGGAKFYVRVYGPSVVAGRAIDYGNGTYDILWPVGHNNGRFTVEVILTFSTTPPFQDFPSEEDPGYEGYSLPGFPLLVHLDTPTLFTLSDRFCTAPDILIASSYDGYRQGRWMVTDRVSNPFRVVSKATSTEMTLQRYQSGESALGIFMTYQPYHCHILTSLAQAKVRFRSCHSPLHVIFVGDSVMKLQSNRFVKTKMSGLRITYIKTHLGLRRVLPNVTAELLNIDWTDQTEDRVIVFNSGLHDISDLCSQRSLQRRAVERIDDFRSNASSCVEEYRLLLTQLVGVISSLPVKARIFQTTSAAWMKYGNFGFAWPPDEKQFFSLSTHFSEHFNDIAFEVITAFGNVGIVDAYWLMLARPDNREVDMEQHIGRHMVHPGNEVCHAMVMIWMTLLADMLNRDCIEKNSQAFLFTRSNRL